ncbi:MAG: FtsQ-type POTRA domain-containing protein [Candidatus Omnitrophica bacterium]|nr:FtsQ-type POTRA domain-containing protein [Candidatus Omnitrophota bacterium]
MRRRRQRQRLRGIFPRLLSHLWAGIIGLSRWLLRHPQPFGALCLILAIGWLLRAYMLQAEDFRVSRVAIPVNSPLTVSESLVGTNIWRVDVEALADTLGKQQPWLKEVRVIRQLPDTLRIDPIPRVPIAQVRLDHWYSVDRAGFLWPSAENEPNERLVRIAGLGTTSSAAKLREGEKLAAAVRIAEKMRRLRLPSARRVTELDVSDLQQLRLVLDDDTQVLCGSELELDAHLERLRLALKKITQNAEPMQYIDVRFQDPVALPRSSS